MFDFLLKNEEKNIFRIFDDTNPKKNFGSKVFIIFFSTFAKEILIPKGRFGQKTREI